MKKIILISVIGIFACSCKKSSSNPSTAVTETQVLTDFVQKLALPEYANLQVKATALNNAVLVLNASPTSANLAAAQQAWRDTRTAWETCEGFLFGPVEDFNYDPNTDTWPVDYHELDSLIANSPNLDVNVVQNLISSLRGYHPLEFILWGQSGNATVDSITAQQKQYMVALSQDILNNIDSLNYSWSATGGNFQKQVLLAGAGATRYTSHQDAFLAIVGAMSDICNEVGQQATGGKLYDPYSTRDSFQTESPFSHNSMADFKNNIIGAQDAYLGTYNGVQGASISNLVSANNISLDNTIKQQFTTAINALNNVNITFETAIFLQRTQLLSAMTALNTLQATLDGPLKVHIQTYVKD
ncbi:MAG: imelysin family protein [Flavipsychrobacter sp.]|nr:imelysin family protein [Flavipsychrobacter sp.]